jgi:FkbM family methyltransferase
MELRYIKWGKFVRDMASLDCLRRIPALWSLQWYLSGVVRKQNMMVISLDRLDKDFYLDYGGMKFLPDLVGYPSIFFAWKDYPIDSIESGDVVLDLGACIGAFSLPASRRGKKIYAVEPVKPLRDLLEKNIRLNGIGNIEVMPFAIGSSSGRGKVSFEGVASSCEYISSEELISRVGKVDVLKLDCEGAEWTLDFDLFRNCRLIFGELHYHIVGSRRWKGLSKWFDSNGFFYEHRFSGRGKLGYLTARRR